MDCKFYKYCAVPLCHNTTIKTPHKLFIYVPTQKERRKQWFRLAGRDKPPISKNVYYCEDHFDLPNDMDNFMEYHIMGSVAQVRMKPGCIPTKFQCQPDRSKGIPNIKERYTQKKQRKAFIEECLKESGSTNPLEVRRDIISTFRNSAEQKSLLNANKFPNVDRSTPEHTLSETLPHKNQLEACSNMQVKQEPVTKEEKMETVDDVALAELYVDHEIKEELVVGPVVLLQPAPTDTDLLMKHGIKGALDHILSHQNTMFDIPKNLVPHSDKNNTKQQYICDICSRTFIRKDHIVHHMLSHSSERPFSCDICHKTFKEKDKLKRHMVIHTGEKSFHCHVCGKRFSAKYYLNDHMRTYTGEKPFPCEICDKTFGMRSTLTKHYLTHTGEKPVMCDMCDKTFKEKSKMVRHMCTHTGEEPFPCVVCRRRFGSKSSLNRHMLSHRSR